MIQSLDDTTFDSIAALQRPLEGLQEAIPLIFKDFQLAIPQFPLAILLMQQGSYLTMEFWISDKPLGSLVMVGGGLLSSFGVHLTSQEAAQPQL